MDGAPVSIEARWLVACDGMHSTVREQAGIQFDGAAYEQGFVLADLFEFFNRIDPERTDGVYAST